MTTATLTRVPSSQIGLVGALALILLVASYRVEAVDTSTHTPAIYLAEAGIPMARGWCTFRKTGCSPGGSISPRLRS